MSPIYTNRNGKTIFKLLATVVIALDSFHVVQSKGLFHNITQHTNAIQGDAGSIQASDDVST